MNIQDFSASAPGRFLRTSKGYWAFHPHPLPRDINWSSALISSLSEAERNLAHLSALADSTPSPHVLVRPFIHREAVLSSRIEGTRASLGDLFTYEANQLSFITMPADVREVYNYVRALEFGLERRKVLPVSLRLIREMHAILMEGVRGEQLTPGEFRQSQNWIGLPGSTIETATYVPPPVEEMVQALDALEKYIHSPSDIPQLVRIGLIHYQFEAIHPFLDGNGRIGRLLIILLLMEWGVISQPIIYLSAFFEAHRFEYYDRLLGISLRGDWENWLEYFLRAISYQSIDAISRIESLGQLRNDYHLQVKNERAAIILMQVVEVLFAQPILSIHQLGKALKIPYRSAQRYVEKLVTLGVLREGTGKRRNRVYHADAILRILEK